MRVQTNKSSAAGRLRDGGGAATAAAGKCGDVRACTNCGILLTIKNDFIHICFFMSFVTCIHIPFKRTNLLIFHEKKRRGKVLLFPLLTGKLDY